MGDLTRPNPGSLMPRYPVRGAVIWKFELRIDDALTLTMPQGSRLLSVQVQAGKPCLWAMVDPSRPRVSRRLAIRGTGHSCDSLTHELVGFVGTFQLGAFVGHLFDLGETLGEHDGDYARR